MLERRVSSLVLRPSSCEGLVRKNSPVRPVGSVYAGNDKASRPHVGQL